MDLTNMTFFQYLNMIISEIPVIAKAAGYSTVRMFAAFTRCYLITGAGLDQFKAMHLYKYTNAELRGFLTQKSLVRIQRIVNKDATKEETAKLSNKQSFNTIFSEFIKRDWVYIPHTNKEQLNVFFERNERSILKPVDGSHGMGIRVIDSRELNIEEFWEEYEGKEVILEAFIKQHPAVSELNPTSVNTVRIITARYKGKILFVGAGLRCGGAGAVVDNFHNGGSAYPIDVETGIVSGPGQNLSATEKLLKTGIGKIVVGFQIPHWELLKETVVKAAMIPENLGYLAWDVAITPDGVDFVEVNDREPGTTIIQLDGKKAYKNLKEFIESC